MDILHLNTYTVLRMYLERFRFFCPRCKMRGVINDVLLNPELMLIRGHCSVCNLKSTYKAVEKSYQMKFARKTYLSAQALLGMFGGSRLAILSRLASRIGESSRPFSASLVRAARKLEQPVPVRGEASRYSHKSDRTVSPPGVERSAISDGLLRSFGDSNLK
jgi:hypothetical protein